MVSLYTLEQIAIARRVVRPRVGQRALARTACRLLTRRPVAAVSDGTRQATRRRRENYARVGPR